ERRRHRGPGSHWPHVSSTDREEAPMKLRFAFPLIAALAGLSALAEPARASHCGACAYPTQCCLPEQCCMPVVRYRVCYRTVVEDKPCTCYGRFYHTVMKECRYTP